MSRFVADSPGGATRWLRRNLFRNPLDGAVTVVGGLVAAWILWRLVRFVLVTGRWEIVEVNLRLFMYGRYPEVHVLRLSVAVVVAALVGGLVAGVVHARQVVAGTSTVERMTPARRLLDLAERFWPLALGIGIILSMTRTPGPTVTVAVAVIAAVLGRIAGNVVPRRLHPVVAVAAVATPFVLIWYLADAVGWNEWTGMMLNVFLAVSSILLCFPFGVLLALGRRSRLPLLRGMCTVLIELVRGAPLYVLLLMANVALGFFVPQELAPGKVVRAIVVFTIFSAAYVAEIVRGGLQSLPSGQEEAAKALGLSPTADHVPDHRAAGVAQRDPGRGRPVHQLVQGHDPRRRGHGPVRGPAGLGGGPGAAGVRRPEPPAGDPRLRRPAVLGGLVHHVA